MKCWMVKLLLAKDGVNPDSEDIWGQAPLSWVPGNGLETVVEPPLAKDGVNRIPKITTVEHRCCEL